jgi:hypothetical protein
MQVPLDLHRVRSFRLAETSSTSFSSVRHDLLARNSDDTNHAEAIKQLIRIDRYERRVFSRRRASDAATRQFVKDAR